MVSPSLRCFSRTHIVARHLSIGRAEEELARLLIEVTSGADSRATGQSRALAHRPTVALRS
jgi:hypothetical protein